MGAHRDAVVDHLQRMHGGDDRRVLAHLAGAPQQRVLEIGRAVAAADARALARHRDRADQHEVDRMQLVRRHRAPVLQRAAQAGRAPRVRAEPRRVDLEKAALGAQSGHRDVDDLALAERGATQRQLRRGEIELHHLGALPDRQLREQVAPRARRRRSSGCDRTRPGIAPPRRPSPGSTLCGGSHPSSCAIGCVVDASYLGTTGARGESIRRTACRASRTDSRRRMPVTVRLGLRSTTCTGDAPARRPLRRTVSGAHRRHRKRRQMMTKPVCATMRCAGRMLSPRTCQGRSRVSVTCTAPKPAVRA